MKIIVTGASGLVARFIIEELAADGQNEIFAVSSRPEVVAERHNYANVHSISVNDFKSGKISVEQPQDWALIHGAFTRKNDSSLVVEGMDYAYSTFRFCRENHIARVLQLSTRSVYREPGENELNTEDSAIAPGGAIGIGKYGVELLLDACFRGTDTCYSNLRLASVNELKTDLNMVRPLNVFVDAMLNGQNIRVVGGMQIMSYIDPRDIATAVSALLRTPCQNWKNVYNIGTGWMCTGSLLDMARKVVSVGVNLGLAPVEICVEEKEVNQHAGLDITRIQEDTGWQPVVTLEDMILALYQMKRGELA